MEYLSIIDGIPEDARPLFAGHARAMAWRDWTRQHGLYQFCTEDIACYLDALAPAGRRCLTVAASGDQAVNLLMAGASEVVAFDAVEEALYGTSFKLAALQEAEDGDPRAFRGRFEEWLEPEAFRKVARRLGIAERRFFDASAALGDTPAGSFYRPYSINGFNPYVQTPEAFSTARAAVAAAASEGRISLLQADLRSLPHAPGIGTFDAIVLSNIVGSIVQAMGRGPIRLGQPLYARNRFDAEGLASFVKALTWPVAALLRPGGAMLADYVYAVPYGDEWDAEWEGDPGADLRHAAMRKAAFEPPPGFTVEEIRTETRNGEMGGEDVAIIFRRG